MSARLKLKNLKKRIATIRSDCEMRESAARYEAFRYRKLVTENIQQVCALCRLEPTDMYRDAQLILHSHTSAAVRAIVSKYVEHLSEYVYKRLADKYSVSHFSEFTIELVAAAITEDHIKIHTRSIE